MSDWTEAGRLLSKEILKRRHELGMTQRQLAEEAKLPRTEIVKIEIGTQFPRSPSVIEQLATAFKVDQAQLLATCPGVVADEIIVERRQLPPQSTVRADHGGDNTEPAIDERLARNLAELRSERGLSQRQLAEISGVDRNRISAFETRTRSPQLATLAKLAQAFGVPATRLIN